MYGSGTFYRCRCLTVREILIIRTGDDSIANLYLINVLKSEADETPGDDRNGGRLQLVAKFWD